MCNFMICLNVYSGRLPCYKESDYSLILNIISNFLLMANASFGTLVYGMIDQAFRQEFFEQIKSPINFVYFRMRRFSESNSSDDV